MNGAPTSNSLISRAVRYAALRSSAAQCGELVDIRGFCQILAPEGLTLGSRISIHPFCYIDATGGIDIGNDVSIAHGSSILSTNHTWSDGSAPIRDQPVHLNRTVIEDNVWIGAGARIMAGVTIGTGSVIAAGAIVTRDVPAGYLVGGVPARVIRVLKEQ
ncbi:acyltransferase [Brachybacterium paraconglomeratum]|uniref:acyltransferase n=1 Tax=Brachybacterium paraconglomeratum TaxID=173362 RepID=UPI0038258004